MTATTWKTRPRAQRLRASLVALSAAGWALAAGLALFALLGGSPGDIAGLIAPSEEAHAGAHFSDAKALEIAEDWASGYAADTIGSAHGNVDGSTTPAVAVEGRPLTLDDFQRVDFRFVPDTREMVTSIDSGISLPEAHDLWVVSWEREGVFNVHTGKDDGTANLVVVLEDGTGKVFGGGAGIRQPEVQARARGPLPSYDELFDRPAPGPERTR